MSIFTIDGQSYNVGVVQLERGTEFLDKFAERTEDGVLRRQLIGVYFNYYLSFPEINSDSAEYEKLFDKITEPVEFHRISVPGTTGGYTFQAYITAQKDKVVKWRPDGNHVWGGLKVSFIAQEPARKPATTGGGEE